MKNQILIRQQLYDEVWHIPLLTLSKKYQISDAGLRKICIRLNIPLPKAGHWMKIKFGKKIKVSSLPLSESKEQSIELAIRTPENLNSMSLPSPRKLRQMEIEKYFGDALKVSERLSNPDKIISTTKAYYLTYYKRNWESLDQSQPKLDIKVSQQALPRALRFMDTLIKSLKKRGHQILTGWRETFVKINGHEIQIALREKNKIIKDDTKSWTRTNEPTGILVFKIDRFGHKEWTDGKVLIEEKLSEMIATLELKAEELHQRQIENEIRKRENERIQAIQLEFEKRRKYDLDGFKLALDSSVRWHQSNNLRAYINEYELRSKQNGNYSDKVQSYLERLRQQVNWYDPFINSKDELLDEVDKHILEIPKNQYNWHSG